MSKTNRLLGMSFLTEFVGILVLLFWFMSIEEWEPLKFSLIALIILLTFDFVKKRNGGGRK